MKKVFILLIFSLFACVGLAIPTKVTRIIDGDTFETENGEKVRLIGINAPEITDIFGQESKRHLSQLINGLTVELAEDQTSNDRDKYNRLLRYVFLQNVDINKKMITDGYAFAYLKYHFDKEEEYKQAQLSAAKNNNGIWGSGSKEFIIKEQSIEKKPPSTDFTPKSYLLFGAVLLLIILGAYYYYKK